MTDTIEFLSCKKCWPEFDLCHSWINGTKGLPQKGDTCDNCHIGKIEVVAIGTEIKQNKENSEK